jgi:hypothetical protein
VSRRRDPPRRSRDLGAVLARRRELIERCAVQREELALHSRGLLPAFAAGDKVVGWGRSVLSHRVLLAGAGVLLVVLWPRRVFALATRAIAVWQGMGAARRILGGGLVR